MFEIPVGISEGEALSKLKASRKAEPETAPTEEPDVVNLSEDNPEEANEPEAKVNEEVVETEEAEQEEVEQATTVDEDEDLYVEYKGREINLKDIEEWEQGNLRQSDYTRKTQAHAEEVKAFEAKQAEFTKQQSELNEKLATVEAMIDGESKTAEQVAEMREYEPEEYIKYMEKQQKIKELLKSKQPVNKVDVNEVSNQLFAKHPEWISDGKQTDQFTSDMKMMNEYAQGLGYSNDEIPNFEARHYETMLDAAKYRALKNKSAVIDKKVRKAPVSTKPKQAAQSNVTSDIKKLEAQVRKLGRPEDFVKLRQLKRQLNN